MGAGDLRLDSSGAESPLSNVPEMATKWNAVLLLNETVVLLEQRSSHDLERNKIVSIFIWAVKTVKKVFGMVGKSSIVVSGSWTYTIIQIWKALLAWKEIGSQSRENNSKSQQHLCSLHRNKEYLHQEAE